MAHAEPSHPKKRRVWITLGLLAGLAIIILVATHRRSERNPGEAGRAARTEIPIATESAHRGDIGVYLNALGTVTPVYTVTVFSRIQGEIMKVNYREGQTLKKGDALVDIDPRPYEAALLQAQGLLVRDQALLAEARIDLKRYRKAYARNAIPKQQLDDQAQLVKQDEGTVTVDQGALENAKVNLAYCHIASPIDGRVGLRLVDPGNIVQANSTTALAVVAQFEPITVIFNVAEDYVPELEDQLRHGNSMSVEAFDRAQTKKLAIGTVLSLDNQVDVTTGTVRIRAQFDNKDSTLFPNQFVNVRLLVTREHDKTLVSNPAIQRNEQGAFVYVITSDHQAHIRTVKTGTSDGSVTVIEGLNPGDTVAVNGFDKLQDGAKVTVENSERAGTVGARAP